MAASCAVCLGPIAQREEFVLSGTEVFHRECVVAHGTAGSVTTKLRMKLSDQKAEIERLRIVISHARKVADDDRKIHDSLRRASDSAASALRNEVEYRRQRDEARRERDDALAARDAASRLLALAQTLVNDRPAPAAPTVPPTNPANDDRDAAVVRFSLLELDES